MLQSEPHLLALYGLFLVVLISVQVVAAMTTVGLPYLVSPRDEQKSLGTVPDRLARTVSNSVTAMALVAPAVLLVETGGVTTPGTALAMQIFLVARIAYAILYPAGVAYARTLVFSAGFLATAYLYVIALSAPLI